MLLGASAASDLLRALIQGLPAGTVYALLALGLVLTYKTSGIFNLALGAQAYVSAALYFQARVTWGWPIVPALVVSVLVFAPALGWTLERLVFRHLRNASEAAKLVITIGLAVALPAMFNIVFNFESIAGQTPVGIVPGGASVFYDAFGVYSLSRNELVAIIVAAVAMAGLAMLFRFTAVGLQMRAVVESPRMTELAGIRADRVSSFSWALSSTFAGLAGVLIAPRFNTLAAPDFFNLMVIAIAAAAIAMLVSLPRTLAAGLGLGLLIAVLQTFLPRWEDTLPWLVTVRENLSPAIPFVVLFGVLVFSPAIRVSRVSTDPLSGVDPPRPAPASTTRSRGLTIATRVFAVVFFTVTGLVVFFRADASWTFLVTQAIILSIIFLSVTVITGMAGDISLCQGTFAAIGAFTMFQLANHFEMSVLGGALIGAVLAALVGALLALPVLRLSGIWLSIATLAFAYFFDSVMVKFAWVGGGDEALITGTRVPRPILGPFDMADNRAFLVMVIVLFAIVGLAVIQIREGTVGQTLRALRGSQLGAQSIGISPGRSRIVAFTISAFIAGLGGAVLAMHQQNVNYASNFSPFAGLFWLVLVVSLGSRSVEGALQAGAAFALFDAVVLKGAFVGWILRSPERIPSFLPLAPTWAYVLFGLGALQFARHPEGMVENGKRNATHRVEGWAAAWRARHATADGAVADQGATT